MPWFTRHQMADDELWAICRFVKHLGPAGSPVPGYVPPGQEPAGPHVTYPGLPNERSTLHDGGNDGDRASRRRLARTGWVLPLTLEAPVI